MSAILVRGSHPPHPSFPISLSLLSVAFFSRSQYAPFVYRRRYFLIAVSAIISAVLEALAYSNFAVSTRGIILFKDKYNLGRALKNKYMKSFYKFKKEEGVSRPTRN